MIEFWYGKELGFHATINFNQVNSMSWSEKDHELLIIFQNQTRSVYSNVDEDAYNRLQRQIKAL